MSCRALISFALSRQCLSGTLPRCAYLSSVVLFGRACLEPVGSRTGRLLIGLSMPLLAERPANRPIEADLRERASPACSAAHGPRESAQDVIESSSTHHYRYAV